MKRYRCITLLILIVCFSCNTKKEIQVEPDKNLQRVIDSIVSLHQDMTVYELFVNKTSDYRCFMTLHIGSKPFYEDEKLASHYFISSKQKIKIYAGEESYFNLPGKSINYGNTSIDSGKTNFLWAIHLYKNDIISIFPLKEISPFLIEVDTPKLIIGTIDVVPPNLKDKQDSQKLK